MTARRVVTALVILTGFVGTAHAQFEIDPGAPKGRGAGRLELSGFIGGLSLDQALGQATNIYQSVSGEAENIDFGKLYGFRASWAFTPMLAAEFTVSGASHAYSLTVDDDVVGSVSLGDQFAADELFLGGSVLLQFPRGHLVPYATGGLGLLRTTPQSTIEGIERVSTLDVQFGGGVKFWFPSPQWLGVRFDVRYRSANDGIGFPEGGSTPKGFEITVGGAVRLF